MSKLVEPDLSGADRAFATANTPLYLIRNLKKDQAVKLYSRDLTAKGLFKRLESSLKTEASDFRSSVLPYVFLVAISLRSDKEFLRKAATLPAPYHHWYRYSAEFLLSEFQSTSVVQLTSNNEVNFVRDRRSDNSSSVNQMRIDGSSR